MFNPCNECYLRYNKQYTKECDLKCDYAKVVKESKNKDKIIERLLDMLENQHPGLRYDAVKEIENILGIKY